MDWLDVLDVTRSHANQAWRFHTWTLLVMYGL